MSFKVKDLAMNVGGFNVDEASTCSTWTRFQTCKDCGIRASPFNGSGNRNLSALRAQLRQVVTRA